MSKKIIINLNIRHNEGARIPIALALIAICVVIWIVRRHD